MNKLDFHQLNAELNILKDGKIQFDKDQEATRAYFLDHINQNTVFFHSLEEKLHYLVENNFYEKEVLDLYDDAFIKDAFKHTYSYKFRFPTFMGALKYYRSYTLKTNDGSRYLERYEDRVTMSALYLADGNKELVMNIIDEIINGRLQPATPTFNNAGKKQRGEMVSCFPAGALVETPNGKQLINELSIGDEVISHDGSTQQITDVMSRMYNGSGRYIYIEDQGGIVVTDEHPFLVKKRDGIEIIDELKNKDGSDDDVVWVAAKDLTEDDHLVMTAPTKELVINSDAVTVNEYLTYKITSIEEVVIEEDVYNLEVENTHTYVVNGAAVHNCFLVRIEDSMDSISRGVNATLQLSKRGGGVALLLTNLREDGAPIKGIENQASGIIPVMKMIETAQNYANQLGSRNGAVAVYLNVFHPDIMAYLDTKRENADEAIRIKTLSLGVVIPDIAFELAKNNDDMYLFSPYDVERVYGVPFSDISVTEHYHDMVNNAEIRKKKINARKLFETLAELQFESGYPYVMYEDNVNKVNPIDGRINMSNLCVSGETQILTDRGYVQIDNVVDTIQSVWNGEEWSDVPVKKTNDSAELLEVKFSNGKSLKCTPYHKFKLEGQEEFFPANELKVGDVLEDYYAPFVEGFKVLPNAENIGKFTTVDNPYDDIEEMFVPSAQYNINSRIKYLKGLVAERGEVSFNRLTIHMNNREFLEKLHDMLLCSGVKSDFNDRYLTVSNYGTLELIALGLDIQAVDMGVPYEVKVESVTELSKKEPTYCFTEEKRNMGIFNGVITGQCVEILQINTPSSFNEDLGYDVVGQDISCNLASLNIAKTMDGGNIEKTVGTAIRALSTVSVKSNIMSVPSIHYSNQGSRAIGLGQMNLHGFFGREGIEYGSQESLDFVHGYFSTVAYYAIKESCKLAIERQSVFDGWSKSKYASGEYFEKYVNNSYEPKFHTIRKLFESKGIVVPSIDDWKELKEMVMKNGLYNRNLQAVPPTGSISYINNSTSSIHPITNKIEARKEGSIGRVYYPAPHMTNDNLDLYKDAYEIGPYKLIDVYAAAGEHIDQGLSMTLFFSSEASTRDINKAQIYAWKKGIKTIYYVRVRQEALEGTETEGCVSCAL